jgi:TetR/AcrR family transcriptional regulator, transcriptional repressor for nem operon
MPYSPAHKHDTRQRILESARRLFNRKGFAEVSIAEIMANAGLTHGGFYRHFRRKDEVYAAAVRQFLCPRAPEPWQAKHRDPRAVGKARARNIVEAYFSADHCDDHEGCCPLIGVPSDVSRGGQDVKAAYREVVEMLVDVFEQNLDAPDAHERALTLVALCVGGMVLARGVGDPDLADDFRRATYRHVFSTAGWSRARRNGEATRRKPARRVGSDVAGPAKRLS